MEQVNKNVSICDEQAAEPVVEVPVKSSWKFPIVPVILVGLATVMALISLIGRFSFLNLAEFLCLSAIVAGMIVMKKERNLLTGFGFIALALCVMIQNIRSQSVNLDYAGVAPVVITVLAIQALVWLADIGIGITYLVGKPKLAGLKTAGSIVAISINLIMLICSLAVMRGSGAASLISTFLLETVTLYVGAILYTPFQK